jgi:hypothetical protein
LIQIKFGWQASPGECSAISARGLQSLAAQSFADERRPDILSSSGAAGRPYFFVGGRGVGLLLLLRSAGLAREAARRKACLIFST